MKLSAIVDKDDLSRILSDLAPLRFSLGARGGAVTVGRPTELELVPRRGVRLGGAAMVVWDVAGLRLPVNVRAWRLFLTPAVVRRENVLTVALDPILETLDFEGVPAFVADRILAAINDALAAQRARLAWAFGRTLAVKLTLPARMSPAGRFELVAIAGEVEIADDELRFTVTFTSRIARLAETRQSA